MNNCLMNNMKCIQVLMIILVLGLCYGQRYAGLHRDKRQEDQWGERGDVSNRQMETTTTRDNTSNPCNPYELIKPNFNNGRRKSEAKCFEYMWELKNRDNQRKRSQACFEYLKKETEKIEALDADFVIGGQDTLPADFSHMGALGWRAVNGTWLFKCGSSLISPKFLLTAAHCSQIRLLNTTLADTKPEIVRLGDKNIIDDFANGQLPMDVNILQIIVHPLYKPPKKYYDIALVELVSEVTFDKFVQPACLWTKHDTSPLGTRATVTGWDYVDSARQKTSPELQVAFVDIIDTNLCNDLLQPAFYMHFKGMQAHQLCAVGVDSCQAESGDPLQVTIPVPITTEGSMSYVIGVRSFGFICSRPNMPGVYTRVSSFIDWIENIVWM